MPESKLRLLRLFLPVCSDDRLSPHMSGLLQCWALICCWDFASPKCPLWWDDGNPFSTKW